MASGRQVLTATACVALLRWLLPGHGSPSLVFLSGSPPARSGAVRERLVARRARELDGRERTIEYKINEQIRTAEVRVTGIVSDKLETGGTRMEDTNEIMSFQDALALAKSKGVDVVMVNEDMDPPIVKIASVGKYVYEEKKRAKETAKNAKQPKVKEVKVSYTVGDHDLNTKLKQCEKWLQNKRQQVKFQVIMKGRTKMFEKQARDLLERVRREAAPWGRVPGLDKGAPAVIKDPRGDLIMLLNSGPDRTLLKELVKEAGGKKALAAAAAEDEDDEDEDEEDEEEEGSEEVRAIEAEIQEMREDLLECGIKPGQLGQQPEMQDLYERLDKARAACAALGASRAPGAAWRGLPAVPLVLGASGALAALLPRRRRRGGLP